MVGDEPFPGCLDARILSLRWSYYAVHANEARSNVTIFQKARFGIGDIYFLSRPLLRKPMLLDRSPKMAFLCGMYVTTSSWRYYGKTEVVEGTVKKVSPGTLHLEDGQKLEVQAILKLFGFVADWAVDKFLQLKQLQGLWVNGDYRVGTMSEFTTVNAQRFGGTSLSPGAIGWCNIFYYFWCLFESFRA